MGKVARAMVVLIMLVLICPTDDHHDGVLLIGVNDRRARTRTHTRTRAIIYARGTRSQINDQIDICNRRCAARGYLIIAIATDRPGKSVGWEDANRMHRRGLVDVIVLASASQAPDYLESTTGDMPGLMRQVARQALAEHRRTRPMRPLEDGGA